MTEIQWIIQLMTGYGLSEEVKKLCLERIGEVERNLTQQRPAAPIYHNAAMQMVPIGTPPISAAQARDMAISNPVVAQPLPKQPTQEIITGVGNGTQIRGKRKF